MKITIYQINSERDKKGLMYCNMRYLCARKSSDPALIDSTIYDKVYEFELDNERLDTNGLDFELEKLYSDFNCSCPSDFKGRSLSVSDIIGAEGVGFFFCDTVGFCRVRFEPEQAGTFEPDDGKRYAVRLGVGGDIDRVEVGRDIDLATLQQLVGGYIEAVTVRSAALGNVYMLVDEEGKLKGKEINSNASLLYANVNDCIAGTAILLTVRGEEFAGFTEKSAKALMDEICWQLRPMTEKGETK